MSLVSGYLASGSAAEEIIAEFSDLTKEQIAACLDFARDLAKVRGCRLMALRFLADHCIPNAIVKALNEANHEVIRFN